MTSATGVMAVVGILFDPRWLAEGPLQLVVSWQGIAAAATVMAALLVAAVAAARYRPARPTDVPPDASPLRRDDLLFIAVAVVPGAVIGGRIMHGLAYADTYAPDLLTLLDPARGSLSLLGAVVGGTLSGAYIARTLGGGHPDWRRWLEVAAPILLMLIVGAKFSQFLGGGGQGTPWDGEQAVAFLGPGPWQSIAPAMPSLPSQLLEASWAAIGVLVLAAISRRVRLGAIYLWALAWWLAGRIVIAFSWRDDPTLGPLSAEQLAAIVVFAVVAVLLVAGRLRARGAAASEPAPDQAGLEWPDRPIDPTELPSTRTPPTP
ncbi:MAG: prolipoprotein diacylglyceryl transferase family protein [Candidatus Limnocylindrales bacterium]